MKKILGMVLVCAVLLASNLREGIERFEKGDFAQAQKIFIPLAKAGDTEAAFYVGMLYFTGEGGEKNLQEAGNWFERVMRERDPNVKEKVFKGISKEYDRALYWFRKIAQSGHVKAQFYLGVMYAAGRDIDVDYKESAHWFKKAALQGDELAQLNIAMDYINGLGVGKDVKKGMAWLEKAARQGNVKAQNYLGYLFASGESVSQNYEKARYWYLKAAKQNYATAQYNLALMYCLAKGVQRDLKQCAYWTKQAYENGLKKESSLLWEKYRLWKYQ
ncbi:tetratricopeptide repeat protein [Hydrogenimonas urashimensis]|uniref:tetratricopeptide repeat protein n=1 Tax=Hydrogenimonas urashimensis TaxID=2740515 RepID=UPI0019168B81|nr:tetratricopeptide repeat protein [Hydrogenimonas urashimensis]